MEVRKFEAFSMNDAIKLVKKELGRDAVILSTREKETLAVDGGDRRLRVVEVVAAAASSLSAGDEERYAGHRVSASVGGELPRRSPVIPPGDVAKGARTVDFPRVGRPSDTVVVKGSPTLAGVAPQTRQNSRAAGPNPGVSQTGSQERLQGRSQERLQERPQERLQAGNQSLQGPNAGTSGSSFAGLGDDARDVREEIGRVRRDLESLPQVQVGEQLQEVKVLLHELMRARARDGESGLHEYQADISVRLRAAGVKESIISDTMQTVSGVPAPRYDGVPLSGAKLREFYLAETIKVLFRGLAVTGHFKFDRSRPSVACLVGPTGVGKTTTIAKLAARLKLTDGRKVTLVSMDTFRIGGADQLRVYAKILDCPFAEVSEPHELVDLVARQPEGQVVLVDTAGRNARHEAQMEGLARITTLDVPVAVHLVLAATMKQRDLDENMKAYRSLSPESLLFTKLDESWSYGEILNCSVGARAPLSYFTTGQKVPEDLEPATKERVVERLFRL
jgi:flagellar biosynthesis protein FlhF